MRLKGKNAVVTGSSRGIGKAIALGFAKQGANVILTYTKDAQKAEETLAELKAYPIKACALPLDLGNSQSIQQFYKQAITEFEKIDVLVNNAGTISRHHFFDIPEDALDYTIATNLKGPFMLMQLFGKHMSAHGKSSSIINITSISAFRPEPNIAHYECAKAGSAMLTKSAAFALAPYKVRVNAISPGLTATDMTQPKDDQNAKPIEERALPIPLGRAGQPQDHVGAAIFLASDESSWVTGANIVIDGGESM